MRHASGKCRSATTPRLLSHYYPPNTGNYVTIIRLTRRIALAFALTDRSVSIRLIRRALTRCKSSENATRFPSARQRTNTDGFDLPISSTITLRNYPSCLNPRCRKCDPSYGSNDGARQTMFVLRNNASQSDQTGGSFLLMSQNLPKKPLVC